MSAPRIVLGLSAVGFLGFGAAFAIRPEAMAALIEIGLPTATARADFAATYGGFELGFGAFLLLCARRPGWLEIGLYAAMLALAGFAAIRLSNLVAIEEPVRPVIYFGLALEIGGVLLNGWALQRVRRSRP